LDGNKWRGSDFAAKYRVFFMRLVMKNMRAILLAICMAGIATPATAQGVQQLVFSAAPSGFVLNGVSPLAAAATGEGQGDASTDIESAMREFFGPEPIPATDGCFADGPPPELARGFGRDLRTRRARLWQWVREAECRHGLPAGLLDALVLAESRYQVDAVSPVGAGGLTQLMPGTAKELGVLNRFDPIENIDGGARYLRAMLDKFGAIMPALAAYNAGPGAVMRHRGVPPYRETQGYVRRVTEYWGEFGRHAQPRPPLYAAPAQEGSGWPQGDDNA